MSYSRRLRKKRATGLYIGPTLGLSSPKNSRQGCLCTKSNTYSTKCCDGYLQNQGIGQTSYPQHTHRGAFSSAFSNAFDITIRE